MSRLLHLHFHTCRIWKTLQQCSDPNANRRPEAARSDKQEAPVSAPVNVQLVQSLQTEHIHGKDEIHDHRGGATSLKSLRLHPGRGPQKFQQTAASTTLGRLNVCVCSWHCNTSPSSSKSADDTLNTDESQKEEEPIEEYQDAVAESVVVSGITTAATAQLKHFLCNDN